jgi:cell division protein FtsL
MDKSWRIYMSVTQSSPLPISKRLWIILMISCGISAVSFIWINYQAYIQYRQTEQDWQTLASAEAKKVERKFSDCIAELEQLSAHSRVHEAAQHTLRDCQESQRQIWLDQAKSLAAQGDYPQAIYEAERIPKNSAVYDEAQQIANASANRILQIAADYYQSPLGRLNDAIAALKDIPTSNSLYHLAQSRSQDWQQTWATNQQHWQNARTAVEIDDFETAQAALAKIPEHPYWNDRSRELLAELNRKQQQYSAALEQAQEYKLQGAFEQAIKLAKHLPSTGGWGQRRETLLNEIEITRAAKNHLLKQWVTEAAIGAFLVVFERLVNGSRQHRQ